MDGALKLEEVEVLRLELLKTEIALYAEASLRRKLQGELASRDSMLKALEAQNACKVIDLKKVAVQASLDSLLAELGDKYGIDLQQASYDDGTGIIYEHALPSEDHD